MHTAEVWGIQKCIQAEISSEHYTGENILPRHMNISLLYTVCIMCIHVEVFSCLDIQIYFVHVIHHKLSPKTDHVQPNMQLISSYVPKLKTTYTNNIFIHTFKTAYHQSECFVIMLLQVKLHQQSQKILFAKVFCEITYYNIVISRIKSLATVYRNSYSIKRKQTYQKTLNKLMMLCSSMNLRLDNILCTCFLWCGQLSEDKKQ